MSNEHIYEQALRQILFKAHRRRMVKNLGLDDFLGIEGTTMAMTRNDCWAVTESLGDIAMKALAEGGVFDEPKVKPAKKKTLSALKGKKDA
jgi:hypothetical protein